MTQPTHLIGEVYAVPLTDLGDHFKNLRIMPADNAWIVPYLKYDYRSVYHTKNLGRDYYCGYELPLGEGSWQLIGTTKEVTEGMAKGIVEYDSFVNGYKDYDTDNFHHDTPFIAAMDSFRSMLTSKGMDQSKNYVILKKIEKAS